MKYVNSEMAEEYNELVSNFYNNLDSYTRNVVDMHGGIGSQKLYLFENNSNNTNARVVTFETDISWSSVSRYTGYSTAAIAGASCFKWGVFRWVRYSGLAVCFSGIGCMGTLMARWSCSPQMEIIVTSIKNISNSISKMQNITTLTDEEKRNAFLDDLSKSLQTYIENNPNAKSNAEEIILFIDSNYVGGKSFYTAVKDIVNYCLEDGQVGLQLATVGVSTGSVVTYCWFTGVVGVLQKAYLSIIEFIPDWLTITTNSISICLKP